MPATTETATSNPYRIEREPADTPDTIDAWVVYQSWLGDDYDISGELSSEEEAHAVVAHFAAFGSPAMHSHDWIEAFASIDSMLSEAA